MAKIIRRETRKRGFFGWLFLILFFGFNLLMVAWLIAYGAELGYLDATSDAERTGRAIGTTIGVTIILVVWTLGSVITGLLALLTRGRRTIIEE